jgi:hypothetical protein
MKEDDGSLLVTNEEQINTQEWTLIYEADKQRPYEVPLALNKEPPQS